MSANSALYAGSVMHQRLRPARHRLRYRVFSLWVDLDELPDLARRLRLFSFNRFNLFSLHERDHGARNSHNLPHVLAFGSSHHCDISAPDRLFGGGCNKLCA